MEVLTNWDQQTQAQLLSFCQRHRIVLLDFVKGVLQIAVEGELLSKIETELRFISQCRIDYVFWSSLRITETLQSQLSQQPDPQLISLAQQYHVTHTADSEVQSAEQEDEPVVRFVTEILQQAVLQRASDIHFEPYFDYYRIRFRIDGVLRTVNTPPSALTARIAARLKIMANLDIAERRLPQDGQLLFAMTTQSYTMRLASLPTTQGEKLVLRVMEARQQLLAIEQLGMGEQLQQHYYQALHAAQGLILVTGPTGSGKTVTLYSGLALLNTEQRNICSVEDPVEIELTGINQTQINIKAGLDFSRCLKAFLRQDPDVIMVGEIRDQITAEIAIAAAQTGHLVLSTLHTQSTVETVTRLSQIGIAHYLLAASLRLVIAQRLVRKLCLYCRRQDLQPTELHLADWSGHFFAWQAPGCDQCIGGYYGRIGLYEMLVITREIRAVLLQPIVRPAELQVLAISQGMLPLLQSGITLVEQGITSLKELYRVLGEQIEQPVLVE